MSTPNQGAGMYRYFVSYAHRGGFGNCEFFTEQPITTFDQVTGIGASLAKQNRWPDGSVVVLSYQPLSSPARLSG